MTVARTVFGNEDDAPHSDYYTVQTVLAEADEYGESIFDVISGQETRRADPGW